MNIVGSYIPPLKGPRGATGVPRLDSLVLSPQFLLSSSSWSRPVLGCVHYSSKYTGLCRNSLDCQCFLHSLSTKGLIRKASNFRLLGSWAI